MVIGDLLENKLLVRCGCRLHAPLRMLTWLEC